MIRSKNNARPECIELRGARQNNLQGIDVDIPLGSLTVICGVSGSGKTSLALDTLYAEGQRRYIESFSAYMRQFLERIEKPKYDRLDHLPASVAITREQRSRNNRSTVGTASEILEYLRVLFAQFASLYCYRCSRPIQAHSPNSILEWSKQYLDSRILVGFPFQWQSKIDLAAQLNDLQREGFVRLLIEDRTVHLADDDRSNLAKVFPQSGNGIVIVDRLRIDAQSVWADRMVQSITTAFQYSSTYGNGSCVVVVYDGDNRMLDKQFFAPTLRCEHCEIDYPNVEPRLFNFNNPIGACELCEGFGETVSIDMDKVVPDKTMTLREGAILPWQTPAYAHEQDELLVVAHDLDIPMDVPISKLKPKHWKIIHEGSPKHNFGGLNGFFAWLERKKYKVHIRSFLSRWRTYRSCSACHGKRLNQLALSFQIAKLTFADLCELPIDQLMEIVQELRSTRSANPHRDSKLVMEASPAYAVTEPLKQVIARLEYLKNVGLGYVALDRTMHTLSTGEAQRVMLTKLLGSALVDMLYVLDEPTVGLHAKDSQQITEAIMKLRNRGNTVVIVEHEPHIIRSADRVIEIGPRAGTHGGQKTFEGSWEEFLQSKCLTAEFVNKNIASRRTKLKPSGGAITLFGATGRNLKNVNLRIPLRQFVTIVGPSGSGKSSLILDTLCPAITNILGEQSVEALSFDRCEGAEQILHCIALDQSPIQRSTRSCPVTYTKALDDIRAIYSQTAEAKSMHFGPGHFSFNSTAGQCPTCEGLGYTTINMQFMADITLPCTDCNGKRFKPEVLTVRYRDLNIAELLDLSVDQAIPFFRGHSSVQTKLSTLKELGLEYLQLGRNLSTLSAGESMRLKLTSILSNSEKKGSHGQLIVMDEPTTGLHFSDIDRLIDCIGRLVEKGNTVVVIEHNEQLISCADYLIELGPGAGPAGGEIVAQGDLESIRNNPKSLTAKFL